MRHPVSFFIYLHRQGVSVDEYVERMGDAIRYNYFSKFDSYERNWPEQWLIYKTTCRLTDTEPH
jgi:hypothetical protein